METVELARFVGSLVFVLALFLLCAWLFKRFGVERHFALGTPTKKRHITVEETIMLDAKHRMIVVKRGARRYVLLLGGSQGVIVDTYEEQLTNDA